MQLATASATQSVSHVVWQQKGSAAHTLVQHAGVLHPPSACGTKHGPLVGEHALQFWVTVTLKP
jgi:hypothetical protein